MSLSHLKRANSFLSSTLDDLVTEGKRWERLMWNLMSQFVGRARGCGYNYQLCQCITCVLIAYSGGKPPFSIILFYNICSNRAK